MTWTEVVNDTPGYIDGCPHGDGVAIDREVAAEQLCRKCGGQCYFRARWNQCDSYKAYFVCTQCGEAVEF